MLADTIAVGFGEKTDILRLTFTDRFDGVFDELSKIPDFPLGEVSGHYTRAGVGSALEACDEYQGINGAARQRHNEVKGPEVVVITLMSSAAALQSDCNVNVNRRELQRIARMQGLQLDQFLSGGKYANEVAVQTEQFRGFIRDKGCGVLRSITTKHFPNIILK
jgi:hypothetical protein